MNDEDNLCSAHGRRALLHGYWRTRLVGGLNRDLGRFLWWCYDRKIHYNGGTQTICTFKLITYALCSLQNRKINLHPYTS